MKEARGRQEVRRQGIPSILSTNPLAHRVHGREALSLASSVSRRCRCRLVRHWCRRWRSRLGCRRLGGRSCSGRRGAVATKEVAHQVLAGGCRLLGSGQLSGAAGRSHTGSARCRSSASGGSRGGGSRSGGRLLGSGGRRGGLGGRVGHQGRHGIGRHQREQLQRLDGRQLVSQLRVCR